MPEGSPHFHTECEQAATEEEDAVGTRPGFALDAAGSRAQWGMPRKTEPGAPSPRPSELVNRVITPIISTR